MCEQLKTCRAVFADPNLRIESRVLSAGLAVVRRVAAADWQSAATAPPDGASLGPGCRSAMVPCRVIQIATIPAPRLLGPSTFVRNKTPQIPQLGITYAV